VGAKFWHIFNAQKGGVYVRGRGKEGGFGLNGGEGFAHKKTTMEMVGGKVERKSPPQLRVMGFKLKKKTNFKTGREWWVPWKRGKRWSKHMQ